MTMQQPLPLGTLTDRVAAYLWSRAGQWVDGRELAQVGGYAAWRSRVSDCRTNLGLTIENRTYRRNGYTVSEYRLVRPARQKGEAA